MTDTSDFSDQTTGDRTDASVQRLRDTLDDLPSVVDGWAPFASTDVRAVLAEVDRLRAAVIKYGQHEDDCNVFMGWGQDAPCDCGLTEVVASAESEPTEAPRG